MIINNVKECKSKLSQSIGLMFQRFRPIVFIYKQEESISIHMMFMFYPVDLLYLNKDKKVVERKRNLKPFHLYKPLNKAQYIVEMEDGFIEKNMIYVGETITWD